MDTSNKDMVEYLKKKLNSKVDLIKFLFDTQKVLDTIRNSKRNKEKGHLKVEPSPTLTIVQHQSQM